ncbi:MAG: flagellar basal-body MS-ring/collar protein FliF [Thermodesulfobacteriaceae bacterium]|jgi:flagellar M-ring protein FliF
MPPLNPREVLTQIKASWERLTVKQKVLLVGSALGLTFFIILGVWLFTKPSWGLLYRGLDEATTGHVLQYLKEKNVPYKVTPDGAIYVPEERVPELRMEIASKGLIGPTGPGFELFDRDKLAMTEFQEKVTYQRALEGELARTIMGIRGVKSVRVHLAMPKESLFIEEEKPAKASVLIKIKPGHTLTREQIRGIVNLVSGAVPGLDPQNVTIVDANTGKYFTLPEDEEQISLSQLAYKRRVEAELKNKVEELLNLALGYGKAQAQVSVDISFDKESIQEEIYDPEGIAVRSEDAEEETRQSMTQVEGGVPGVRGALIEKFEATEVGPPAGETYSRRRVVRNYEVSRKVRTLEITPGMIKKISVAVVVDKAALGDNATARLEWIENLVRGAIGYNAERGDEVKVEAKEFPKPEVVKPGLMDYLAKFALPIGILLGIVLVYFLVLRPLLKRLKPAPVPPEAPPVARVPAEEVLPPEEEELMPKEIALGIIRSQPERAAALVKKWLLEETLEERKRALAEVR